MGEKVLSVKTQLLHELMKINELDESRGGAVKMDSNFKNT